MEYTPQERANLYTQFLMRTLKYARAIEWEVRGIEHQIQERFNTTNHARKLYQNVFKFFAAVKAGFIDDGEAVAIISEELDSIRMISMVALMEQCDNMTTEEIEEVISFAIQKNKSK